MSEALVERLNAAEIALRDDRPYAAVAIGEAADRIEALEREVKERKTSYDQLLTSWAESRERHLAAEAREARLSEALEKAAIALDEASEEVADWGAYAGEYFHNKHDLAGCVDHVRNEATDARAALSGSSSGWPVPDGWKLVPVEPTEAMYRAAYKEQDDAAIHNYGAAPTFIDYWIAALEAAPAAPQQGGE